MNKLTEKDKPRIIKLENKEYKISPLNLNLMTYIEEELDCSIEGIGKLFEAKTTKRATALRKLLYVFLKDNYPDMTLSKVGELVNIDNLEQISTQLRNALISP